MRYLLCTLLTLFVIKAEAQYDVIYENSFKDWTTGQGWVMINNDTVQHSPEKIANSVFGGVPTPFYLEIFDYMLGVNQVLSLTDKVMITPPIIIQSNTYLRFYSYVNSGAQMFVHVIRSQNDTTMSGVVDYLGPANTDGFNIKALSGYAGDTIRLAFQMQGLITKAYIDDILFLKKKSNAWIPDFTFRTYLKTQVPAAFVGDSLNYVQNSVMSLKRIIKSNSNITTLEGMQYFVGLKYLDVANNDITYIPPNRLTLLDTANAENNFLPYFPDAPLCTYLKLNNNLVKTIPDLNNTSLMVLQLKNNLIYDCLTCSNRWVLGDMTNNVFATYECILYNMLISPPPPNLPFLGCGRYYGTIKGRAYYDLNQNSAYDAADIDLQNQRINFLQGTDITTLNDGTYAIKADSGLINMQLTALPAGFVCNTPLIDTIIPQQVIQHDFIVTSTSAFKNLEIQVNGTGTTRLNEQLSVSLNVKNLGSLTTTAVVKMKVPTGYTFLNLQKGMILNDTLYWNVNIAPFRNDNNMLTIQVNSYPINQETFFTANVAVAGDIDQQNNIDSVGIMIRDSLVTNNPPIGFPFDPNNKLVDHPIVTPGFQDYLTYNINFENIGTANATRVVVRDFLSTKLDENTFEILSTSHPCIVSFGADNVIQFLFDPIALYPTSVDSLLSHGHIWFRIKPKNPIYFNDTIYNSANIYFDTQAPVLTNVSMVYADTSHSMGFTQDKTEICGNGNVTFRNQTGGEPLSIEWIFPGGTPSTSTSSSPVVNYNTPGLYDVTLIAKYVGYTDTLVKPGLILIHELITPTIVVNGSDSICMGDSVLLTSSLPEPGYHWSTGDTTAFTYVKDSRYVQLVVNDSNGCAMLAPYVYIYVSDPDPQINGSDTICQGDIAFLNANHVYHSYLWSTGSTNSFIQINNTGLYVLTVTDVIGCSGTDSLYVQKFARPQPAISGDDTICGGTVSILDAGSLYKSYLWNTGATTSSISAGLQGKYVVTVTDSSSCTGKDSIYLKVINTDPFYVNAYSICSGSGMNLIGFGGFQSYLWSTGATTQSIYVTLPGYYTLTVSAANNCTGKDSILITVHPLPVPVIAGNDSLCQGQSLTLTNPPFASYLWSTGSTGAAIVPINPGNYIVTVTDTNGCVGKDSTNLSLLSLPNPVITGSDSICQSTTTILDAGSGFASYQWNTPDTTQQILVSTAGVYTVTVTDSFGCTNSTGHMLTIIPVDTTITQNGIQLMSMATGATYQWVYCDSIAIAGAIASTFTPVQDGSYAVIISKDGCVDTSACYPILITGIEGLNEEQIAVYPNPANTSLIISGKQSATIRSIQVYTATGQALDVSVSPISTNAFIIDVSQFLSGMYYLTIQLDQTSIQQKFVIQHQ